MTRGDVRGWLVGGIWMWRKSRRVPEEEVEGGGGGSGLGPRDVATPHR